MPRPFAVIGFTVFITAAMLYDMKTGVTVAVLAAFTVALVVTLFAKNTKSKKMLTCIFAVGAITCALLLGEEMFTYAPAVAFDGKECDTKAVLTSECEEKYGNYYYEAKALSLNGEESGMKIKLVFSSAPEAEPYDVVEGKFSFYLLGKTNDDYLLSHKANGIFLGAYPNGEYTVTKDPMYSEKSLNKLIIDFRAKIKEAIYRILPNENGALAVALIIGDKSRVPDDILRNFNKVGITHIICVSGFHLSLWSMLILKILRKTGMKEKAANAFACIGVVFFMLIAGLSYSVLRSGIMMLVYLVANILSRKRDSLNSLGFALTAIAVYNPFAMGAVSLQLSALSTFGILIYYNYFAEDVKSFFAKVKSKALSSGLKFIAEMFLTTVAATAFILPVTLKLSPNFNFGVFLANPAAILSAQAAIIFCSLGAFVGSLPFSLPNFSALVGKITTSLLVTVAEKTAEFDFLRVKLDDQISTVILCCTAALALIFIFAVRKEKRIKFTACFLCIAYFSLSVISFSAFHKNETEITTVDCGNGTAVLLSSGGKNYLFGCGGTAFLGSVFLSDAIDNAGAELEAIVLPDTSEYAAAWLNDVLKLCKPAKLYCNEIPYEAKPLLSKTEIFKFEEFEVGGAQASAQTVGQKSFLTFKNEDLSLLVCFDPEVSLSGEFDVVISRNDYIHENEKIDCKLALINCENARGIVLGEEMLRKEINCAVTAGEGNVVVRAENGFVSMKREK